MYVPATRPTVTTPPTVHVGQLRVANFNKERHIQQLFRGDVWALLFCTWSTMMVQMPAPRSAGSPYIPVITYTTDWPTVITIPNTGRSEEDMHNITKGHSVNASW